MNKPDTKSLSQSVFSGVCSTSVQRRVSGGRPLDLPQEFQHDLVSVSAGGEQACVSG